MEKNKPICTIRTGNISGAVFKNVVKVDGKEREFASIKLVKVYKDKDDKWCETSNFNLSDLPKLTLVAETIYRKLMLKEELDLSDESS